ncbi:MAG TPA: DUF4272 domain-containing protein [Tenuifilaceae bacterium]|nr:DUF4272 domain-containing protein [Tenuifilaceae bacterium]HPI44070.1 DUF4272 domain-containing protein [Tenuifilaceae bacterium]HPN22432.1 DUF4272 domain-containing protein [Tenuifilaceae bacterium]
MSIFKKIFGSSENEDQSKQTTQGNILETYKNIPWMTDLRLENISICLNAGFKPATSLPTDLERQIRPKVEIAKRLNAIKAIVLWLMVSEQDLSNERILNFVVTNGLDLFLAEDEKHILNSPRNDEELRNMIGWKFENTWPLAWYFGYNVPDITGQMTTGEQMQEILINYTCPLDGKIEDWVRTKETVSDEDLKKKEDLFYCLHNAVRSAQLGRQTVPPTFDPVGNGGVIHERRHSLTWMLSMGIEWDETDLST